MDKQELMRLDGRPGKSNYGTAIQTGTTCKKVPCYIRDSACRGFIVK